MDGDGRRAQPAGDVHRAALITILLIVGISESATFNNIVVFIKITVVLLFIAFGAGLHQQENWEPFIPPAAGPGKYGWDGVVRGAGVIFFAYIGFDAVSTAAQETRNPQRDMPIGILGSLAICTVLYIVVALVLTGIVKYTELNVPDPIAVGINAAGPGLAWLRPVVKIGAIAGLSSVILVMLLGQPRIFYTHVEGRAPAAGVQHGAPASSAPPGSPARSPAWSPWRSPGCCRSGSSASWSPSGRCWHSRSSAPACWSSGSPIPTGPGPSARRSSRSSRSAASWPASTSCSASP